LLGLLTSCGETGTAPDDPSEARLEVLPDSIVATQPGQLAVTVTLGGQAVTPALSVRSERRWLDDRAVLDATALASGQWVARGPGRAVVQVSAGGQTDSVIVNVVPARPYVFEARPPGGRTHLGDGDTLVLRGYRMDAVTTANIAVPGGGVTVLPLDSANARVVIATAAAQANCAGTASSLTLSFSGIDGVELTGLTRKRTGELSLAPGEAKRLTDAEAMCLRFAPNGNAGYLLAYADTRLVTRAQAQPEFPWPDSILVTVEDASNASPTPAIATSGVATGMRSATEALVRPHAVDALPLPGFPSSASIPVGCPFSNHNLAFCRAAPYVAGEAFPYYPAGSQRPAAQARVLSIRGNLVGAVFLPDSTLLPAGTAARLDTALARMRDRAVPLLQRIFDLSAPTRTSDESGQLLISLEAASLSFANWWPEPPTGHGRWGKLTLHIDPFSAVGDPVTNATRILLIAAHEILHTYQFRWRFEHASPWLTYLGTAWGVEGAAVFFSMEMVREVLGVPFLSNYTVGAYASADPFLLMQLYTSTVDDVTRGYLPGASFLRDLQQRLVDESGIAFDDAIVEVTVGALEGWWGINEEGQAHGPGLTARMRQHLGVSWHPADALLDWTMSQAADDLTTNPRYQNRTVRQPAPDPGNAIMRPHATIANGLRITVTRSAGNTGVWRLDDTAGGTFRATGHVAGAPSDALEWLILRIN
jgi:hypothetical protein